MQTHSLSSFAASSMILLAFLLLFSGCASQSLDELTITLSERGVMSIAGKPMRLVDLPERMRRLGATPKTGVRIETPPGVSMRTLKTITTTLASKGYTRLIFTPPERASATVKQK